MPRLSFDQARALFDYNPETGDLIRTSTGKPAGTLWCKRGITYRHVMVGKQKYYAHRLAWFLVHEEWPDGEVDHINGDGSDNRISNLRVATRAQNATNALAQKSSKIGLRGVHFHPGAKRYRAQICKNNKTHHLGYFDTPDAAHEAYLKAAHELHGEFVRERVRSVSNAIAFRWP